MPRHYRPYVFVILASSALLLLSAVFRGPAPYSSGGPTPYTLSYPSYFGSRINTTDDNPLTIEGIGLDSVSSDQGRSAITGMGYDKGRFRVVTLRNIALTAPYMHDGRFATLQEVIDHYSDHILPSPTLSPSLKDTANAPVNLRLSGEEKADILAFLQMLTDSVFITDPRFSDPFAVKAIKTSPIPAIENQTNK